MKVKCINPGFEYMIDIIMEFQTPEWTNFWSEPLYYHFKELDKEYAQALSLDYKKAYIKEVLFQVYRNVEKELEEKVILYQNYWDAHSLQIEEALSDAFDVDCKGLFNDMICRISLNPIEPRFLKEHSFDIFYKNSEKGMIGEAIHEIIHFVWFYVWNREFGDEYEEYESPSLKWLLSEMVVEMIMKDERLSSLNPYFPRENGGCIYPYFFDMRANDELVLEYLENLYKKHSIREFMRLAYEYCQNNEEEIREHIHEFEAQFDGLSK